MDILGAITGAFKSTNQQPQQKPVESFDEYADKQKDLELFNWIKSKLSEVRESGVRIAHEAQWMQNCAYTVGYAGLRFNAVTRTFQNTDNNYRVNGRGRATVNKILPILQIRLARLCKNPPRYDVRPNDNTQEAKDNARFKLDILTSQWETLKLAQKRTPLLMWAQQASHAYIGIFWDDTLGRMIEDPITKEAIFEGDIRAEVISPFEVTPDPAGTDFDSCRYFIRSKVRSLDYFVNQYGEKGKLVKEEEVWLQSLQNEQKVNTMNAKNAGGQTNTQKNCAIEIVYYEKPSLIHPRGRMIVGANGIILEDKELPCGKIPLVKFDDIAVAGKFYPEAVVTHLISPQDRYNLLVNKINDWIRGSLAAKLLSPRGNNIGKESFTDQSNEIIQFTPVPNAPNGGMPMQLQMPAVPQYAFTEKQQIELEFNDISGINEVDKGILPAAGIPALGMQLLVEQTDSRIGIMVEQHEQAWAQVGTLILDYVQEYYETPRKMKFAGKQAYVIKDISGKDLKGTNDVTVVRGSTIPGSKALRRQEVINAWQSGLLGDPADPKVRQNVLSQVEFGDVAELYLDNSLDANQSKREIESLEAGILPEIHEMDNHEYALLELNRYRKSEKFLGLPPDIKEGFLAAIEEHLRFIQQLSGAVPPPISPEEDAMAQEQASLDAETIAGSAELMPEAAPPTPEGGETEQQQFSATPAL